MENLINSKKIEWTLRIAVFGEFLGHGVFGLQGKQAWINWISQITGADAVLAGKLLFAIGVLDIFVAVVILFYPMRLIVLWAAFWGFFTALIRPIVGEPIWDFIERFANFGAPLALLFLLGLPRNFKDLFRK